MNPEFQAYSHLLSLYSPFVSDLVGKSVNGFSRDETHMLTTKVLIKLCIHTVYYSESVSSRPRVKSARVSSAGSTRPGQVGLIYKV